MQDETFFSSNIKKVRFGRGGTFSIGVGACVFWGVSTLKRKKNDILGYEKSQLLLIGSFVPF